jgi:acyl carrier protein
MADEMRRADSSVRGQESGMDNVAPKIIEILRKHMKNPDKDISLETKLEDLEIESLDLAMIVFDIEDSFGVEIPYNANEEVQDFKTVGSVVDRVTALLKEAGKAGAAA